MTVASSTNKRYVAVAPLVVVEDTTGAQQYVYAGREITFDVDAERIDALLEGKFIAEVEVKGDEPVAVAFSGPPARGAKAADWTAFAIASGMDADEVEKLGKKGLVARFLDGEGSNPDAGTAAATGSAPTTETVKAPTSGDPGTSPAGN